MKIIILLLLHFTFNLVAQNQLIDSLNKIIAETKIDSIKIGAYSDLSWELSSINPQNAIKIGLEELKFAQLTKNNKYIAQAYNDLAISYYKSGKLSFALENNLKSLDIRLQLNDNHLVASSYNKISIIYNDLGSHQNALKYMYLSLEIFEKNKDTLNMIRTYDNISTAYSKLKLVSESEKFIKKSDNLAQYITDLNEKTWHYCNVGYNYSQKGQFDLAIDYYEKASLFAEKSNNKPLLSTIYINFGYVYSQKKDQQKRFNYYQKAYDLNKSFGGTTDMALICNNLGAYYYDKNDFSKAQYLFKEGLTYIDSTFYSYQLTLWKSLTEVYIKSGQKENALFAFQKVISIKDSIFNKEGVKQIMEMKTKYEMDEISNQNLLLMKENQINELELKGTQNKISFLIFILVLIILGSFLYFNYQRFKITEERFKQQALLDQEKIKQQVLRSEAIIETENHERSRIAKDLHDGVGQILSTSHLNLIHLSELHPEIKNDLEKVINLVNDSIKEVRLVSHELMPQSISKKGLITAIEEFLDKLKIQDKLEIEFEVYDFTDKIKPDIEVVIYRVLQEITNNIIKHAKATHINIQLSKDTEEILLIVEDNGIGFDFENAILKSGIGLKNIISRVELFHGKVNFDSKIGNGTTITVEIPI